MSDSVAYLRKYAENPLLSTFIQRELLEIADELEAAQRDKDWKRVDTELPKPGVPVLAFFLNSLGNSRRIRAYYYPKNTKQDEGDYSGDSDYDEDTDTNYWPEGWYESNECEEINWLVSENVTHWMPLPPISDDMKAKP